MNVLAAEIWDPVSQSWSVMASMTLPRVTHSTAFLTPDARVVATGDTGDRLTRLTAEVYSPPYLFQGPRPVIASVFPNPASYNSEIVITLAVSMPISKVALVSPSAVTHGFDQNQRYVPLTVVSQVRTTVSVMSPPNPNIAPPGFYMLFVLSSGVPSEAVFLKLTL